MSFYNNNVNRWPLLRVYRLEATSQLNITSTLLDFVSMATPKDLNYSMAIDC